jgi:rfaE bifunctional protein nucleotidyltransferase chain/domain
MSQITVFTNGCYDILHRGHIELFKYCKSLGDILIVGIDTDEKVKTDKGPTRPFNTLKDRIFLLESIKYIDKVLPFGSRDDLINLVKKVNPNILIKGSDWKGKEIVGSQYAEEVKYFERIGNYSTTKILENSFNR